MANEFSTESPDNYQQKCCLVLVLDVSISMKGSRIDELNKALQEFHTEIQSDSTTLDRLEIGVIEFCNTVNTLIEPSLANNFEMPYLTTKGTTKLVDGVREGISLVRARKKWYKQTGQPYYRPWIILITDGSPDSGQKVDELAKEISEGVRTNDFFFFAVGVQEADMNMLTKISDPIMPAAQLEGLKFGAFFKWLSASLGPSGVTGSKDGDKINLPNPSDWMKGFTVN
jgi:uncharacterized protein YegL